MALPVYYLNQSWKQTYGERTNRIVARAFAIFTMVIYEFKNRETKNRTCTNDEFMDQSNNDIIQNLFDSLIQDMYSRETSEEDTKMEKSAVMNSLSFNLSPYVKLLPKFDAIPVLISCLRQDDIRMVKMAVETLTLLCQWNNSFVNMITDYFFSSALFTLLTRLRYNLFNGLRINHTRSTRSKLLSRIRNSARSDDPSTDDEERKRNMFTLDTSDAFLNSLSQSAIDRTSLQEIFYCSEEEGQEQLLRSVLLLVLYMEGGRNHAGSQPSQLITELHASDCEGVLMGNALSGVSRRSALPFHREEGRRDGQSVVFGNSSAVQELPLVWTVPRPLADAADGALVLHVDEATPCRRAGADADPHLHSPHAGRAVVLAASLHRLRSRQLQDGSQHDADSHQSLLRVRFT